jgi:hypothetical protein
MNNKPTTSGYYWLRTYSMAGKPNIPEVVVVCMEYTYRNKVVPFVVSTIWKGPLAKVEGDWGERLESPFG